MKQSRTNDSVQETLSRFSSLPDEMKVRAPVVKALYGGISNSTLIRRIACGSIPEPQRENSRCNSWTVGVLRRHLRSNKSA